MNKRYTRSAGWASYFSGIAAILGLVSLLLFFGLESTPSTGQGPHFWGPVSDICPILQMVSLLVVARALYRMQRSRARGPQPDWQRNWDCRDAGSGASPVLPDHQDHCV